MAWRERDVYERCRETSFPVTCVPAVDSTGSVECLIAAQHAAVPTAEPAAAAAAVIVESSQHDVKRFHLSICQFALADLIDSTVHSPQRDGQVPRSVGDFSSASLNASHSFVGGSVRSGRITSSPPVDSVRVLATGILFSSIQSSSKRTRQTPSRLVQRTEHAVDPAVRGPMSAYI